MKRVRHIFFLLLILFSFLVGGVGLYFYLYNYNSYFLETKGSVTESSQILASGDSALTRYWLRLQNTNGLAFDYGILSPRDTSRRYPAIILLGGKATGKYAIDYALGLEQMVIAAADYPYEPRERYTLPQFVGDVPEIRSALLNMIPSVMLLLDYLSQQPEVDTSRIILLGYSFGAPFVPTIMALDKRPKVAVMVYGAGELRSLIHHNVKRYEGELTSVVVGWLGWLLLQPLEPLRQVEQITPRPLIMINGTEDEMIPRENVLLLYNKAREPKKLLWLESKHVNPANVALTNRIIKILKVELDSLGMVDAP